ncbi:hypothetical protein VTI74DRAFT_6929 [Chaetomium olivicolor]
MASKPLPCEPLKETATFEVLQELSVGDGLCCGRGSQVITCIQQGSKEVLVAKVYDPLYYPFAGEDSPDIPNDVIARAEHDFALESMAYTLLDEKIGGSLIPKFQGSWLLDLPLKNRSRLVGFILLERLNGVPLNTLNPENYTSQARLRVLRQCMEAEIQLHFAGVIHRDIAARNVICSSRNLLADDLRVKLIDFNRVTILPSLGVEAPCNLEQLPESPIDRFWNSRPIDMWEWLPDGWEKSEWNQWLKETWEGSTNFKSPQQHLLPPDLEPGV